MRYYSSTAVAMALTGAVNELVTTIVVDTVLGLPAQTPFTLVLDVGLSTEEIVTVTDVSGTNLTVTRGEDSSIAIAHTAGAIVRHMMTARDLREPAAHVGGAANVHGIGATASVVGTDTTQTLTNKTVNFANNTVVGIPQTAVTGLVTALAGKAPTAHTHAVADTTGLVTALAGKAPTAHTHVAANITDFSAAADARVAAGAIYRLVAPAVVTAPQGPISTTESQVLTSGATQIQSPGGQVRLTLRLRVSGTVKDDQFIFRVRDGSPTGDSLTGTFVTITNTTATSALHIDSVAISAGVPRTLYVTAARQEGTGTITIMPTTSLIVDEDPA